MPSEAVNSQPLPFSVWIFVRLVVPTGPILIQYGLKLMGLYNPPFPQITFVVLLFSLALATLTEYKGLVAIVYGCVIPALCASVLYTAFILTSKGPDTPRSVLMVGFILWLLLLCINIIRTAIDALGHYMEHKRK